MKLRANVCVIHFPIKCVCDVETGTQNQLDSGCAFRSKNKVYYLRITVSSCRVFWRYCRMERSEISFQLHKGWTYRDFCTLLL